MVAALTSIVMMTDRQRQRQTDRDGQRDRETEREREADREREVNDGWAAHCTDGLLHTVPIKHCT